GYASSLPVLAGWGVEVPCMLLEQNVIPGRTNRGLARFVDEVGVQFAEAAKNFSNSRIVKVVGNPLRRKVLEKALPCARQNMAEARLESVPADGRNEAESPVPPESVVLVMGGSQGARALNDIAIKTWPKLRQN